VINTVNLSLITIDADLRRVMELRDQLAQQRSVQEARLAAKLQHELCAEVARLKAQLRDASVLRTIVLDELFSYPEAPSASALPSCDNSHFKALPVEKYSSAVASSGSLGSGTEQCEQEDCIYCMLLHTQLPATLVTGRHIFKRCWARYN
jgi:hypothetical protein